MLSCFSISIELDISQIMRARVLKLFSSGVPRLSFDATGPAGLGSNSAMYHDRGGGSSSSSVLPPLTTLKLSRYMAIMVGSDLMLVELLFTDLASDISMSLMLFSDSFSFVRPLIWLIKKAC